MNMNYEGGWGVGRGRGGEQWKKEVKGKWSLNEWS